MVNLERTPQRSNLRETESEEGEKMGRRKSSKTTKTKTKASITKRTRTIKCYDFHNKKPSIFTDQSQIKKESSSNNNNKSEEVGGTNNKFFGCYLLTSLGPRFTGHSYIGFTVNPKRRIRQHNGEIMSGASRTKTKRPWEMVLCIHGFPSNHVALQFEWAWQHPRESTAVREAAASFKTLGGLANKIKLALTMLTIHTWQSMDLTVSFFNTKYMKHAAGCPTLPPQMKLHFCSMDELPCYGNSDYIFDHDDEDDLDSIDGEVSPNSSDDRIESLADGSTEVNPSPIHAQNSTMEASRYDILEGDNIGIGGVMESESSSLIGSHMEEEHMQPLHQSPVDVGGSMLNLSDEQFQPWSFLASENVFPVIEEEQPFCHLPADVFASTENDLIDPLRIGEESASEDLRGYVSVKADEDHIQSLQPAGSSESEQSSRIDFISNVENNTVKADHITCIVIDDITEEEKQPTRAQSPVRFFNTIRPFSNEGTEVIELCTPSPDFRITACSKKKRYASDFPGLIDLT